MKVVQKKSRLGKFVTLLFLMLFFISWQQQDSWINKSNMPTARMGLTTSVVDGKIYVIGGYQQANAPGLTNVEMYNPITDTWTTKAPMPTGRRQHSACVVNGKIYVFGGYINYQQPGLSVLEEYDPVTDTWTKKADMPTARFGLATCAVDGLIYAIGGASRARYPLSVVEAYNPTTDTWTKKTSMPTERYFFSASCQNKRIYAIGGSSGGPNDALSVVEEYTPLTDSWRKKADMPTKRFGPGSVVINGQIFALGGAAGYDPVPIIELYNPYADVWVSMPDNFDPRIGSFCTIDDKIFHIGGALTVRPPHPAVSTVEVYLPPASFALDKASSIDKLITQLYEYNEFNGSILVAEKGEIIYKKSFGYANREWKIPNTPNTKFRIASMTKQFTALLIMQLVEEGKIELEGTISDYLPEYRKDNGEKVTIHHLLTHTSGIPAYTSLPGYKTDSLCRPFTSEYLMKNHFSGDLEFEPGSRMGYTNGYFLLAVIIEKVTGKSYEENLQERIFIPHNMCNSGTERNEVIIENRATGYIKDSTGYKNTPFIYMLNALGDADIYSTVEDLYLWDQALYSHRLLSEKYKKIMFTPFLNNFTYGWKIFDFSLYEPSNSIRTLWHSGALFGFNSIIIRFVEDKHLIVVCLNNTGSIKLNTTLSDGLCSEIVNILYDRPF